MKQLNMEIAGLKAELLTAYDQNQHDLETNSINEKQLEVKIVKLEKEK